MLAAHLDTWVFFLFVAIAMLFRWLSSAANKSTDSSDGPGDESELYPPPISRNPEPTSDSERIRKFLEALGQPTNSPPPPPVVPRTDVPARPLAPVRPPMPTVTYPRKQKQPPPVPKIRLPEQVATPVYQEKEFKLRPQEQSFEVQERDLPPAPPVPQVAYAAATKTEPKVARPESNLIQMLRSPAGLRNAIILREVFGPPRSMQPLDFIGNA